MDDTKLLTLAEHIAKIKKQVQELSTKAETITKLEGPQGIQGPKGNDGVDGKDGRDGRDGKDGINGKDGKDGLDGVSVVSASIAADGNLVLELSDGTEIDAGIIELNAAAPNISVLKQQGGAAIPIQPAIPSVTNNISSAVIDLIYTQEESQILTDLRILVLEQKTTINNMLTSLRNAGIINA